MLSGMMTLTHHSRNGNTHAFFAAEIVDAAGNVTATGCAGTAANAAYLATSRRRKLSRADVAQIDRQWAFAPSADEVPAHVSQWLKSASIEECRAILAR